VHDELARVFRLILNHPHIGSPALDVEVPEVRRIHLSRIGHYLYYRVLEEEGIIEVLAVWSDSRGDAPPI
jgi:plasmid stabilization system protein ParE